MHQKNQGCTRIHVDLCNCSENLGCAGLTYVFLGFPLVMGEEGYESPVIKKEKEMCNDQLRLRLGSAGGISINF